MKAEANGRWIVTTVIAVLALAVSGYTAYAAWQNNATTVAALEETKRQFEATGPRYSAEAFARIYDTEANSWSSTEPEGTSLAFERMQPPNALHVLLNVTNFGRSRGSIEQVGLIEGRDDESRLNAS